MHTTAALTPGKRIKLAGSPGITGTFNHYYAPLPSGRRNIAVAWDDASLVLTVHESQVVAA